MLRRTNWRSTSLIIERCDAAMAEQNSPAMITETKINGVTYIVHSSFKEGCTETAVSKMAKVLKNELHGEKKCS